MITLATTGQYLSRTTNLPVMTDSQTSMGTARLTALGGVGEFPTLFALLGAAGYAGPYVWYGFDPGATVPTLQISNGISGVTLTPGTTISVNEPFIWGVKRNGATQQWTAYLNGFEASGILDMSAFTPTELFIGGDGPATINHMDMAWYKEWKKILSGAEMEVQGFHAQPQAYLSGLIADCWLSADADDRSGNLNHFTLAGTPTPSFTFSPNITPETAIDLGALPFSISLTNYLEIDRWYQLTPGMADQVVSLLATSGLTVRSYLRAYTPPVAATWPSTATYLNGTSINEGRLQLPVEPGVEILLRVGSGEIVLADSVTLKGQSWTPLLTTIPHGSIVVNSDTPGYPATILDGATGHVLGFRLGVVAGEFADTLHTLGLSLLSNTVDETFALYDQHMNLVTLPTAYQGAVGSGNQVDKFLVRSIEEDSPGVFSNYLRTVNAAGGFSTQRWGPLPAGDGSPLTALQMVAISRDETVAYLMYSLTQGGAGTNDTVKRWDMVNNVSLGDFLAPPAGFRYSMNGVSPGVLLVLGDESIILAYWRNNLADSFLQKYDRTGALQWTMPWDTVTGLTSRDIDRGFHDPDNDTDFFWVWDKAFGVGRFNKLQASDGTRVDGVPDDMGTTSLAQLGGAEVQSGGQFKLRQDQTQNPDSSLDIPFGHPFSCPAFALGTTDGGGGGGGGGGGDEEGGCPIAGDTLVVPADFGA